MPLLDGYPTRVQNPGGWQSSSSAIHAIDGEVARGVFLAVDGNQGEIDSLTDVSGRTTKLEEVVAPLALEPTAPDLRGAIAVFGGRDSNKSDIYLYPFSLGTLINLTEEENPLLPEDTLPTVGGLEGDEVFWQRNQGIWPPAGVTQEWDLWHKPSGCGRLSCSRAIFERNGRNEIRPRASRDHLAYEVFSPGAPLSGHDVAVWDVEQRTEVWQSNHPQEERAPDTHAGRLAFLRRRPDLTNNPYWVCHGALGAVPQPVLSPDSPPYNEACEEMLGVRVGGSEGQLLLYLTQDCCNLGNSTRNLVLWLEDVSAGCVWEVDVIANSQSTFVPQTTLVGLPSLFDISGNAIIYSKDRDDSGQDEWWTYVVRFDESRLPETCGKIRELP
ncbi:MAG: hypothetical protein P1V51_11555 [Deltaproteobacteria bacterium]|nr:hypothetical protein [Deltaproteobacteria bacterium]